MGESNLGALIMILGGFIPCAFFGYLIGVKQIRGLTAGWDESKISSPEIFAKLIGYSLIATGVGIGILALFVWQQAISEGTLIMLLVLLSALPVIAAIYGNIRYGVRGN